MGHIKLHKTVLGLACAALAAPGFAASSINLPSYQLQGIYSLPTSNNTVAPAGSELALEASAVTWNRNTNTLFVMGDEGTSIVQTTLTGQLINSMTLPSTGSGGGSIPFSDTEGLTYVGRNGSGQDQFVLTDERLRTAVQFIYAPGTTLSLASTQQVKLGTTVGNTGLEGLSYDPATSGFIFVNQANGNGGSEQNVFQTMINFTNGTASNGSPTTVNHASLFNPALMGVSSFADVYAMSNVASLTGQQAADNILVLSYVNGAVGRLIETDRSGSIKSTLNLPGTHLPQAEGVTMDDRGWIYVVSELSTLGDGESQLFVYAPIPEPSEIALMLAGLGVVSVRARRRLQAAR